MTKILQISKERNLAAQTLTRDERPTSAPRPTIDFDPMALFAQELAMGQFPETLKSQVRQVSRATANALYTEGKDALIRQVARDCAARRVALSQAESLLASYREKARRSQSFDTKKLDHASRDVDREHRRYLASLDALDRLQRPENPVLNINKGQTYVAIGRQEEPQ